MQCLGHIAEVHAVHVGWKPVVHYHNFNCRVECSVSVSVARKTSAVCRGGHMAARACAMSSLSQLAEILRLHIWTLV
jgi:hypothetical protein